MGGKLLDMFDTTGTLFAILIVSVETRGGGTVSADFEFMFNTAVELDLSVEHVLPTLLSIVFKLFTTFKLIGCRSNFATDSCPETISLCVIGILSLVWDFIELGIAKLGCVTRNELPSADTNVTLSAMPVVFT
jgi:hypothetical protein